jgi:hypothetical protein
VAEDEIELVMEEENEKVVEVSLTRDEESKSNAMPVGDVVSELFSSSEVCKVDDELDEEAESEDEEEEVGDGWRTFASMETMFG